MQHQPTALTFSRRRLLGGVALASTLRGAPEPQEGPATHNWMLVGNQTAFLSHLPMFDSLAPDGKHYDTPHRFQVILQGSFADASPIYFDDRSKHPEVKMYTVSPTDPFVLPKLAELKSFNGTVFRGHLERGGKPMSGLQNVAVNVKSMVHVHEFDPAAKAAVALEYLLFGRGSELFLAHSIVRPPDFDQILSVNVTGLTLADSDLGNAIKLSIPLKKNTPAGRLKEGEQAAAVMGDGRKLGVQGIREFYFEEGELRMPATFKVTPEEQKAGFGR